MEKDDKKSAYKNLLQTIVNGISFIYYSTGILFAMKHIASSANESSSTIYHIVDFLVQTTLWLPIIIIHFIEKLW